MANLGTRSPVIPSVLFLRDDGEFVVGEAAQRRAEAEPELVAREFKRRIGDPTPLILGGAPCAADLLTAKLLGWVVDKVAEAEGGPAARATVTHPATWGAFKIDLLQQAIRRADLDDVELVAEPEAAAIHYASQERVPTGSTVAVYDLGGGTFDAAVLRRVDPGWDILGVPEGIEHLGGIDFDAAVFNHVQGLIGDHADQLDLDDPAAVSAMARLRQDCVAAKEALSSDTDVSIPVLLPGIRTEVRLTRTELEDMIRPALRESTAALGRAVRSAGIALEDIDKVLLVGGSSRIPLVAQLVGSELGRPVAVDAHPKHGVALGAAAVAARRGAPGAPAVGLSPLPAPFASTAPTGPAVADSQADQEVDTASGATELTSSDHSNWPALLVLGGLVAVFAVVSFLLIQTIADGDDGDDGAAAAGDPAAQTRDSDEPDGATTSSAPSAEDDQEPRDDSTDDASADGTEPGGTGDTPAAGTAAGSGDDDTAGLLLGDATPAFDAFSTLNGGDPRVLDLVLYPNYAFVSIQVPDEPEYADRYQWQNGQLGEATDWSAFFKDESDLFNLSAVDPTLLPDMARRALQEISGDGIEVTHIIIDKSFSPDGNPKVRVYASHPDRTGSGGYVSFGLDGTFQQTVA